MTDLTNLISSLSSLLSFAIHLLDVCIRSSPTWRRRHFFHVIPGDHIWVQISSYSGAVGLRYQAAEGRDETAGRVD